MNRSPLFYPLNRGVDAEGGGAADLQTDVMRFMAILSLCLVAIFALVQSIPLSPVSPAVAKTESILEPPPLPQEPDPIVEPEPVVEPAAEIKLTRPTPVRTVVRQEHVVLQRPKPAPIRKTDPAPVPVRNADPIPAEAAPETPVAKAEPTQEGFTLRFETDAALTRLVARQVVGLYAISPEKSLRMNINSDAISFWPASVPGKFHEMDQSTVPEEVLAAYRNGNDANGVKWGVTLPADMSRELNSYLSSANGGSLIIAGNGKIDLRP